MSVATLHDSRSVRVVDYRCEADGRARPFVEVHKSYAIAYVRWGSFGCRTRGQAFELVRGSFLIGRPGEEYTCTHDHVVGDECLSFHVAEDIVDELGMHRAWQAGAVPPLAELVVVGELAQACAAGAADAGLAELGLVLSARFAAHARDRRTSTARPSPRDRRRAVEAALWIDAHAHEPIDLDTMAARAGVS